MLEQFNWFLCISYGEGKEGVLMEVYVLEQIVRLVDVYETWYWDEVYSLPRICVYAFRSDPPRGGSRAGQNRSMRGPFFKELLFQIRRLQQQLECIIISMIQKHVGRGFVIFVPF